MEKSNSFYAIFSLFGAIAFCLPAILWMTNPQFSGLWILYVGNFSLMVVVFISEVVYGGKIHKPGIKQLFTTGMKVALLSILLSCIVMVIASFADKSAHLLHAPANMVEDKSNGLRSLLALNTLLINIFACSFAAFLAAITLQRKNN
jgi:hypothetical protein